MKQDRQGVRTPADIERKYDLGQDYSKVAKLAADAQRAAEKASMAVDELSEKVDTMGGGFPAVQDDDKPDVYITTAKTLRMGSTGDYTDDEQGELGLGEFQVTENFVGMAVRKDSTDGTRRYLRLYDSNTYPRVSRSLRLIDEDGTEYAVYGEHNEPTVMELVWENTTTPFAAQTISVDLSRYAMVMIVFSANLDAGGEVCFFAEVDDVTRTVSVPGAGRLNERRVTVRVDGINFGNGRYFGSYGSTSRTNDNNYAVPLRIYGIKGVS